MVESLTGLCTFEKDGSDEFLGIMHLQAEDCSSMYICVYQGNGICAKGKLEFSYC